jgi:hypothetical protein
LRAAFLALSMVPACRTEVPARTILSRSSGGALSPATLFRTYSETQPYTSVASVGGEIYVGTPTGLIRFDRRTGSHVRLTTKEGLAGDRILALSAHPRSGLWVATEAGIAQFKDGAWTNHPVGKPPGKSVSAMVAVADGVWAGGADGLGRLGGGAWKGFLRGARVTHLVSDLSGTGVWVATDGKGIFHLSDGQMTSHTTAKGQRIGRVQRMTLTQTGGLLVAGLEDGSSASSSLSFFDGTHWTLYRPRPAGMIRWVQTVGSETLIAFDERVLVLRQRSPLQGGEEPPAGPVALDSSLSPLAPKGYPAPLYRTEALGRWLPADTTVVVGHRAEALIGTETSGLLSYDGRQARWYRTHDLTGGTRRLSVACSAKECFSVSNGVALRYDDGGFETIPSPPDSGIRVLAFVDEPGGGVLRIHRVMGQRSLVLSRLTGTEFREIRRHEVTAPSDALEIRFARFDARGDLWVGLQYRDVKGDLYPWGMAVLLQNGKVLHHRSSLLPTESRVAGSLALPDDIRGVLFAGDQTWVATSGGACRARGDQVVLFTENDGLQSEIVHGFLSSADEGLLIFSHGGVGRFDGKSWHFDLPEPLSGTTRALLFSDSKTLWAATSQGLVRRRSGAFRTFTGKDGLAGEDLLDLYLDRHKRLWILTDQGLSIYRLGSDAASGPPLKQH